MYKRQNMLKDGKGDAFVSAGSTGALHVGASLIVRTLKGIKRPDVYKRQVLLGTLMKLELSGRVLCMPGKRYVIT